MDCIVHGDAKSWTRLSDLHFQRSRRLVWDKERQVGTSH